MYDSILSLVDSLDNAADLYSNIEGFFTTVNSLYMPESSAASYLHPLANPYDLLPEIVSTIDWRACFVASEAKALGALQIGLLLSLFTGITLHRTLIGAYENANTKNSSSGGWNEQVWKNQVRLCKGGKCKYGIMK